MLRVLLAAARIARERGRKIQCSALWPSSSECEQRVLMKAMHKIVNTNACTTATTNSKK